MRVILWFAGGLAALALSGILILSAMSLRPDAGRLHASTEIARKPGEVWPWLSEADKVKLWVSWLKEVRPVSANREIWVMQNPDSGGEQIEVEGTVTSSNPPRSMTIRSAAKGGFEGEQTYELTDLGNGRTRLETHGVFRYIHPLARLMEPVVTRSANEKMTNDFAKLKGLLEDRGR